MKKYLPLLAFMMIGSTFLYFQSGLQTTQGKKNQKIKSHLRPPDEYFVNRNYPYLGEGEAAYQLAVQKSRMQSKKLRNQNTPWTIEGPHNIGGRINTIAIDPNNSNIIYIGTPNAGIFKSTDGGNTWTHKFSQESTLAIGVLAIDPSNSNTIYAGTGDKALSSFTYLGSGLYKSTDGGNTWVNMGLNQTAVITKILIHPTNPNIIYAGTMGNIYTLDNNRGLYRTTNGGVSWTQVLYLGTDAGIGDLTMDKAHPDTLFATGRNRYRSNAVSIASGPDAKIFRSYNGGISWDTLTTGLPAGDQCKITLALSQSNPQLIYASYCDMNNEYGGLYKSTNGGNTWNFVSLDPDLNMGGFGWYFGEIRLDPNNNNRLFWMGIDLYRSTDGGQNWSLNAPAWYSYDVHADKHDLQFINSTTYLLATDGGLYRTSNSGGTNAANWAYKSDIPITQFYRVAFNVHDSLNYYGGAQDNGTQTGSLLSGLNNWDRYFGGDGFKPSFDELDPDTYYTETQNGSLYCTTTGGSNFDPITQSLTATDRCNWNTPYVLAPNQTMYIGTYMVYKNTSCTFDNWAPISGDLTDGTNDIHHTISALDLSKLNNQLIYAGTSDGRVWVTQNDGGSWQQINSGLPNRYVSCIKASPNNASAAFLSYWGYRDNDTTSYIYYTGNYGASWTLISGGGLPNFAVNDIWIYPNGSDSSLIIANDGGVYSTNNRGLSWKRVGNNMPIIPVYDIEYNPATKKIFAGTFAMSMQSILLDSIFAPKDTTVIPNAVAEATPLSFKVYPIPCFNELNIEPGVPHPYSIMIYSSTGMLVNAQKQLLGKQQIPVGNFVAGIYFVELYCEGKKTISKVYKQ